jgi:hypothetical protein
MQQQQQQTINKLQSLTLTKNLLLATIGSIAYVRMLFPEDNFLTKGLDGIAVKTLKQNVSLEANTLLEWIERGVFDAIQKQYLHQLVFGIYLNPENPLDVIEQYQFEFTYPDKDSYGFSITKVSMTHLGNKAIGKRYHKFNSSNDSKIVGIDSIP